MKKTITLNQYDTAIPFHEVFPSYDTSQLPLWVKNRLDDARVYGNTKQMLIFSDGKKYQLNNSLNDLSGGEWLNFTRSVVSTWYPTNGRESYAHSIRKVHPTPKPPQLMKEIIEFFTKENEIVFDYFMGVGGTLLGSSLSGRRALGIDLNQDYIEAYKSASMSLGLPEQTTICGDSLVILQDGSQINDFLNNELFSLILIDPPYGNMMARKKTGGDIPVYGEEATPFTSSTNDLGNMELNQWLQLLKESVWKSLKYLKPKGYVVTFIKDLQPKKKQVNLLHADIVYALNDIPNLFYKGMKIWEDKSVKLFPYGYPLSFVANQTHQYILIFRKEK